MLAHVTERGIELEPQGNTERYAVKVFLAANPDLGGKIFILGDVTAKKAEDKKEDVAKEDSPKKNEREIVIAELESLGVAYDKKQSVAYLRKLLEKAKAPKEETAPVIPTAEVVAAPTTPIVEDDIFAETPAPTAPAAPAVKIPTKEEFREAVKLFAAKNGTEKTKQLLLALGNFASVSQVPEDKYIEAMEKMK